MNAKQIKNILKGIVLFIFGLFEIILLIRVLLRLIGASTKSSFVTFWYNLSAPLFRPFEGTVTDLGSGNIVLEINSLIAIIIFAVIALAVLNIIFGFLEDRVNDKVKSLIETVFKIVESILGLRLVFKIVGAGKSGFITLLYAISSPFYEPFKGILPSFGHGKIVFETATFIALVIIIIIDYASDKLLDEVFKDNGGGQNKQVNIQPQPVQPAPQQNVVSQPVQPVQPVQQPASVSSTPTPTVNVYNAPPVNGQQTQQPQQPVPTQPQQQQPVQPIQ